MKPNAPKMRWVAKAANEDQQAADQREGEWWNAKYESGAAQGWKGWQQDVEPSHVEAKGSKGNSKGSKSAPTRKFVDYYADKAAVPEPSGARHGKGAKDDRDRVQRDSGARSTQTKGSKSGEGKGKGSGKSKSSKVSGAKTVQELEVDLSKPWQSAARVPRGPDNSSKRPMDATGEHCVVHKHSGMGCAVITLDSKAIRDAIMAYAERTSPSSRKAGMAELEIEGLKVEIKHHVDRQTQEDVETDIFAAWGHQAERRSMLDAESIAQAFDALYAKAKAEPASSSAQPQFREGCAGMQVPLPQQQVFVRPSLGVMPNQAPHGGPCNHAPVVPSAPSMTAGLHRPVGPAVMQQLPTPQLMAGAGVPQMQRLPVGCMQPMGAVPGMQDFNPQLAYWMQQQQQQYAQQVAAAYSMQAQKGQAGPTQQFQQDASGGQFGASSEVTASELSRPLPKPMRIVDPSSGSPLETLGMNFKPREPRRPLQIIDPKSGESVNPPSDVA